MVAQSKDYPSQLLYITEGEVPTSEEYIEGTVTGNSACYVQCEHMFCKKECHGRSGILYKHPLATFTEEFQLSDNHER